jgi:hypothetical protein
MYIFDTHISENVADFFQNQKKALKDYNEINNLIKGVCGINSFFSSNAESNELLETITHVKADFADPNRREYGDFQTNNTLASKVTEYVLSKEDSFEFILEPTCGNGSFILASIQQIKSLKKVVGVEIYKPYVWETKFKILHYFIESKRIYKPEIDIIHANAFEFSYEDLAATTNHLKTLVIGNPPWVTNSELGAISSQNTPEKSNFKKHRGLDAMTGKGNFDIGEYISLIMLDCFQHHEGIFAFLIKNSVIKNLIHDQKRNKYKISGSEKLNIDSKKEFNVSVNASLFLTQLNAKPINPGKASRLQPDFVCKEFDFYSRQHLTTFGWYKDKFVNSVEEYDQSSVIDGKSTFVWRSGVKHDCSKVMEFDDCNGHYKNALGEDVRLENNLLYGLLKSSDLRAKETNSFRKLTIITQRKIGEETSFIKDKFPLTYDYLNLHRDYFEKRKSSIYVGKPDFSIFGVGEYSFAEYKVAISGLYKSTHFTLVGLNDSKPIMLDDTCYFIGFSELASAKIAHYLLNGFWVQQFLKSIIFSDAKRSINKDILMRIDFEQAYLKSDFVTAKQSLDDLSIDQWEKFGNLIKNKNYTLSFA